jgi:tripartite-type tricarboxylate transporter receptor subunit TctC
MLQTPNVVLSRTSDAGVFSMNRRVLLSLPLVAMLPAVARAQSYPSKPVRFVVGFPAGGPNDILGRLIAGWLQQKLGQPFEVENKGGKSGNIATEMVVRAPADGYTVLLAGPANALSGSLYPNLSFNFLRDIVPVAAITREPLVMVVHPSVPAKTVPEFLAYAKANPDKVTMASTGTGSSPHVTGELFKQMTGLALAVRHYGGGGPALKAMIAGEAQVMFEPMSASIGPVRDGKLRAIAVTTASRSAALPDSPTVAETVPGYEASAVTGIGVPKGTPPEIVETLNKAVQAAFSDNGMKSKLADTGGAPLPGTAADFAKLMAAETEKWGKVVKAAGIKVE